MNKRIAVFPGSFDPLTLGHYDVVTRGAGMFDELIVALGVNSIKEYMYSIEKRLTWLEDAFGQLPNVVVKQYSGLTVDFCKSVGAKFILRGLRNSVDFEYEQSIAQMSRKLNSEIEIVSLFTAPDFGAINSRIIREIIQNKGDVSSFLPKCVQVYEE